MVLSSRWYFLTRVFSLDPSNPYTQHLSYKPFDINQCPPSIAFHLKREKINHTNSHEADHSKRLAEKQRGGALLRDLDKLLMEETGLPVVIADTQRGATASANLYSLIETAKANGIEPYAYLRTVFTELPQAKSVDEIEALLPIPNDGYESARVS